MFLVVSVKSHVLDETGLDVLVLEIARRQIVPKELVCIVYRGVDDSRTVCPDTVGQVLYVDGVEKLVVTGLLHKHLVVHVVVVGGREHLDIPHYLQHIKPLLQGLHGQMILHRCQSKPVGGQLSHLAVSTPIVEGDSRQVVESSL